MCGIIGIFAKTEESERRLGEYAAQMLLQMADRGPDSAGMAVYRDPISERESKLCVQAPTGAALEAALEAARAGIGVETHHLIGERHALLVVPVPAEEAQHWFERELPEVAVDSAGRSIELYKDAVAPRDFIETFGLATMSGSHALGHTRMATESRVTPEGSHPFSTGLDVCLVHNGSLSNHNRLRAELAREGTVFRTENDSEVAAAYLTSKLRGGATLEQALEGCLEDLDGFYTFAVATADGFAVLRDPIACKPAVMAETDDWVAMASEFRALATLPGAEGATVWEPEPGVVYDWGKAAVR
ncbi:MAG: amidophosphoribosyltransferase [Actinobacteria bacterium]|nr:amidophosphoribosyltransferase [Actinomycetota bacterium]